MIPAVFPRHHHRHSKTLCYMGPLSDTTHTHCRATSATASSDQSNRYWGFDERQHETKTHRIIIRPTVIQAYIVVVLSTKIL